MQRVVVYLVVVLALASGCKDRGSDGGGRYFASGGNGALESQRQAPLPGIKRAGGGVADAAGQPAGGDWLQVPPGSRVVIEPAPAKSGSDGEANPPQGSPSPSPLPSKASDPDDVVIIGDETVTDPDDDVAPDYEKSPGPSKDVGQNGGAPGPSKDVSQNGTALTSRTVASPSCWCAGGAAASESRGRLAVYLVATRAEAKSCAERIARDGATATERAACRALAAFGRCDCRGLRAPWSVTPETPRGAPLPPACRCLQGATGLAPDPAPTWLEAWPSTHP